MLAFAIAAMGMVQPACGQANETALLLQQSPVDGGTINLGTGVHYFENKSEVSLRATPKPGYHFVCWLGDVSDTVSQSTVAYLDSPKIIIAIYERVEYDFLTKDDSVHIVPGGGGGSGGGSGFTGGGGGGGGIYGGGGGGGPNNGEEDIIEDGDFPVPPTGPTGDELPVPVPEPTTIVLLGFGSLLASRYRAKNKARKRSVRVS